MLETPAVMEMAVERDLEPFGCSEVERGGQLSVLTPSEGLSVAELRAMCYRREKARKRKQTLLPWSRQVTASVYLSFRLTGHSPSTMAAL